MKPLVLSVLQLLTDGKYHPIENLAQRLNVSSDCVLDILNDASNYGIMIEKNLFHCRWLNPVNWIDKNKILNYRPSIESYFHLVILNTVDSTNRYLLDQIAARRLSVQRNPVIITEIQTQGRGRLRRPWHSGFGDSLTFSLYWCFDRPGKGLSGLSLAIGVAIIRALKQFDVTELALKWPNDVVSRNRKLAGILIEQSNAVSAVAAVVIGIGLNVQLSRSTSRNIDQPFVDLFTLTGKAICRNKLLAVLLIELANVLNDFNHFGFYHFKTEWISYHAYEGKQISLILPDGCQKKGIVNGIGNDGSIRIIQATGSESFYNGEITLR